MLNKFNKINFQSQTTLATLETSRAEVAAKSFLERVLENTTTVWIVLGVLAALTWGPRLFRSFWVDEAGTYWMATGGPIAAIQKTWHWPGQSVLYSVIESFFCLKGGALRELVLRLPAFGGMLVATCLLYNLAEEAIGIGAGVLTTVLFVLNPVSIYVGTEARPYGLALAAVAASSLALYRWVQRGERRDLLWYVVASTLIVYLHYLFSAIFCIHVAYLLFVSVAEKRHLKWRDTLAAYLIIGLLAVPLVKHILLLLREGRTLPFMLNPPSQNDLVEFLQPHFLGIGLFVAALILLILRRDSFRQPFTTERSTLFFFTAWWLAIPTLFYAVARVGIIQVFVERYVSYAVEAESLLFAAAGYLVFRSWAARLWVIIALVIATPLEMKRSWTTGTDELKPLLRIIAEESKSPNSRPPVFFRSELPESTVGDWRSGLKNDGHLYAPFVAYPMPNRLLPLPFHFTEEAKRYISTELNSDLRNEPEVIFITRDETWNRWVIDRFKQAGFQSADVRQPNGFSVIVFKRLPLT
jgi:Dolichyl-phosphate-mannose-protein mannosyltransferase